MNANLSTSSNLMEISDIDKEIQSKIQHHIQDSMDSIYSAGMIESFSISSSSKSSSRNSVDIQKISNKTKEIQEMVSCRLTAFLFMSKKSYEESSSQRNPSQELEDLKISLDESLKNCSETDDKTNEIFVKGILEQILLLERKLLALQSQLLETQTEVMDTQEEETELKGQMNAVENDINKFITEAQEITNSSCRCSMF